MKLLLHTCCANCGIVPVEELKIGFDLTLFWYNPNIWPEEEYKKRLTNVQSLAEIYKVPLIVGDYENKKWLELVNGFEKEPEGGRRCEICFRMRLEKTAQLARENNFIFFTTTLGVSRYKNSHLINQIGQEIAQKHHLRYFSFEIDKNQAAQRELEISKKYHFYRQKYCGCIYSFLKLPSRTTDPRTMTSEY